MKMKLEFVVHALAYPRILCFMLSGFERFPTPYGITLTLCTADDDAATDEVITWFMPRLDVSIKWLRRPREEIGRRTILRNRAALESESDWCLFTDADYAFLDIFWERIYAALATVPPDCPLAFPKCVMGSTRLKRGNNTKDGSTTGDALIASITPPQLVEIDESLFQSPMPATKAIGGSQWVRGDYARQHGYLNGNAKHMRPSRTWVRTIEDRAFRVACGTPGYGLDVPGIIRLRHSAHGGLNLQEGATL